MEPYSTIDVSAEVMVEHLPLLLAVCNICGSEESPEDGVLRLRIRGDAVPPGHLTATVSKVSGAHTTTLTIAFRPA